MTFFLHFFMLLVSLVLSTTSARAATQSAPPMPVYLMAGQSNMEGNVDPDLVKDIFKTLNSSSQNLAGDVEQIIANWYHTWSNGYAQDAYDPVFGRYQARQLATWRQSKVIGKAFLSPMKNVFCTKSGSVATGLAQNCGNPFGPELMFGHQLRRLQGPKSRFTIVKVAQGGTTLGQDWLPPSVAPGGKAGPNYKQLATRIADLKKRPGSIHPACAAGAGCVWKMFLWFQGENDSFSQPFAAAYQNNLDHLVQDVRAAVGDPNLPVVIVQLGYWPSTLDYGPQIMTAQANYVSTHPRTALVTTKDLSHFYHFDPASQLIIGHRMAVAANGLK